MLTRRLALGSAALLCASPALAQDPKTAPLDLGADIPETLVVAANWAYDKALLDADAKALERILTDDFSFVGWEGEMRGKAAHIREVTTAFDILAGQSVEARANRLGPDAMLLVGRWEGRVLAGGKTSEVAERFTTVWVIRDGVWRLRHEHTAPLK